MLGFFGIWVLGFGFWDFGMAQGYRPDRVGDQIRQELSEILSRGEVHDPGIGFITLTRVQVTA